MTKVSPELQKIADKQNIEFYKLKIKSTKRAIAQAEKSIRSQTRDLKSTQKKLEKIKSRRKK